MSTAASSLVQHVVQTIEIYISVGKYGIKARTDTRLINYRDPTRGILLQIQIVGYCVFYPTGIGSSYNTRILK